MVEAFAERVIKRDTEAAVGGVDFFQAGGQELVPERAVGCVAGVKECCFAEDGRADLRMRLEERPELRIKIGSGAPTETIRAALAACKLEGFKESKITGPFPEQQTRMVTVPPNNVPKTEVITVHRWKNETATIDELLKKLPAK